jgi:hypothetical protein
VSGDLRRNDYPPDWSVLRVRILRRSRNNDGIEQCECMGECGLHCFKGPRRCSELNGHPSQWASGRIVLTTAHLCRKSQCPRIDHLKAMCQRCHLRYDRRQHYTSRRIRWERQAGQERLFER